MSNSISVPTVADMVAKGESPEILFWVGCAGSFDDRAKKITKAIVKILNNCKVKFAVLPKRDFTLIGSSNPGSSTKIRLFPLFNIFGSLVPTSSILRLTISIA